MQFRSLFVEERTASNFHFEDLFLAQAQLCKTSHFTSLCSSQSAVFALCRIRRCTDLRQERSIVFNGAVFGRCCVINGCLATKNPYLKQQLLGESVNMHLRTDLHDTILSHATSSRQAYDMTYDCRSVLKHVLKCYDIFSDVHNNRKSCRGPVVSRCRMQQSLRAV